MNLFFKLLLQEMITKSVDTFHRLHMNQSCCPTAWFLILLSFSLSVWPFTAVAKSSDPPNQVALEEHFKKSVCQLAFLITFNKQSM